MSSSVEKAYVFNFNEVEDELTGKTYTELLQTQLTEYEMLLSMFPSRGEISMDDYSVLADFDDYLAGKTTKIPRQLDYKIFLKIVDHNVNVCVTLPLEYPYVEPDVFVRSEDLNRSQQRALNKDLSNYISTVATGEICILSAISWLQEHALEYFSIKIESKKDVKTPKVDGSFSRFWIYSHHIYSKIKCREILDQAHEYELTGFCLPGKPGIICVEGYTSACQEWWQKELEALVKGKGPSQFGRIGQIFAPIKGKKKETRHGQIKSMSWKKITCKRVEEIPLDAISIDKLRKFPDFKQISFASMTRRDTHMNFGAFYKYLEEHTCGFIFKDCFGVDGK